MMEKIRLGITQGDINGTSYELIIKALSDAQILDFVTPIIYGSPKVASYYRKSLDVNFTVNMVTNAGEAHIKKVNLVNVADDEIKVEMSKPTSEAGETALAALEVATQDLKAGTLDALVTMPINRRTIDSEKFAFPGHTGYFAENWQKKGETMMLLVHNNLKVANLTGHMPIARVPSLLTQDFIVKRIKTLAAALTEDFGIRKPRIAVLGLNPHAGLDGLLGKEEEEIINPAIKQLNNEGYVCVGALKADDFFGNDDFNRFDAVAAMYYDQAMIPFKALTAGMGVSYTANLPVIRTAPVHGVQYELTGKNEADEQSLRNAIYLACDIYRNRDTNREITANPLQKEENVKMKQYDS